MITIDHLSFAYGKREILNDLSLTIPDKAIVGLVGPNGAGKTTFIKLLTSILLPDKGKILFDNSSLSINKKQILSKIAYLPEEIATYETLTAYENLLYLCILLNKKSSEIDRVLSIVGLSDKKNLKVKTFSLGMKRLLTIASALIKEPQTLFLDEPTNGLDPENIVLVRNLLLDLHKILGVTILISSHNLEEVKKMVSRLAIMKNGKIIEMDVPKDGNYDIEKAYFEIQKTDNYVV
jgi:ABC-2 type transport system ATP-binding protein